MTAHQGKLQDGEAARGVLGCLLLDPGKRAEVEAAGVGIGHFLELRNQALWAAICREDAGDSVELLYRLGKRPPEEFGGMPYLLELQAGVPSAANLSYYLPDLRNEHGRRVIAEAVRHAEALASQPDADPSRIASDLADSLSGLVSRRTAPKDMLLDRAFKPGEPPAELRAIYTLNGHAVCTPGNLTTLTAAAKAGKSAVVGAMLGSALTVDCAGDFLGFHANNRGGRALLHFDTEQSKEDHWRCVDRAMKRAGLTAPPPWFYSYFLAGIPAAQAWSCVQHAVETAAGEHGGVHSVLIDGAADLVADVNDAAEANRFVADLHNLAITHDCPIVGVIHFNPGSEKTRGHLGSQLERKAESNLRLDKSDETTSIWSDKQRRAPIPKGSGPAFRWSDSAGMHVSAEPQQDPAEAKKKSTLSMLADEVFSERKTMRYSELVGTVKSALSVSDRTAERKVSDMVAFGVIIRFGATLWTKAT